MALHKVWDGTKWIIVGTVGSEVELYTPTAPTTKMSLDQAISDLRMLKMSRSGKDANDVFTTIEWRRKSDNTLAVKSVLSLGTSPQYTRRTVTFYAPNGFTIIRSEQYTLSYDSAGDLVGEA